MIFNYPHTSMQEMNLDWLIKIAKESKDILDSVHSEIKELFTEWINANYAKLMLNAFYNEEQKEIIFTTATAAKTTALKKALVTCNSATQGGE